eukprot:CAMPEP_0197540116 /NCGR_PEP_ID=MMETSP1318-20131121/64846_1 /TAXON_ID=552666 /ORGANISM="Partenskyella glossopodia, Strain RCC365" /LENGTH=171 /DNA_ID=CAMNT_0043099021 /DNA_START=264 /DNA_END=779 /DNA_ORIENTATION=+
MTFVGLMQAEMDYHIESCSSGSRSSRKGALAPWPQPSPRQAVVIMDTPPRRMQVESAGGQSCDYGGDDSVHRWLFDWLKKKEREGAVSVSDEDCLQLSKSSVDLVKAMCQDHLEQLRGAQRLHGTTDPTLRLIEKMRQSSMSRRKLTTTSSSRSGLRNDDDDHDKIVIDLT